MPGFVQLVASPDSIRTADQAGLDITGDIEAVFCLRLPDWTPATNMILASKWQADSAAGLAYAFRIANFSGGQVEFWYWNGSAIAQIDVDNNGGVDGSHMWLKVTVDVDDGASGSVLTVYNSTDPINTDPASVSWNTVGSNSAGPVISLSSNAQPLWLGLRSTSNDALAADYYYFNLKSGIGGTIVAEMDARTADPTGSDGFGNSWSLNDVTWTAPPEINLAGAGPVLAFAATPTVDVVSSPKLVGRSVHIDFASRTVFIESGV